MRDRGQLAPQALASAFDAVRSATETLVETLEPEDLVAQSMTDASPAKWHLAHTTWFFEAFLAEEAIAGYRSFHPRFGYLFNSYYEAKGARQKRSERGLLTRPTVTEVRDYRRHVDGAMHGLLEALAREPDAPRTQHLLRVLELGLHHEQQHQELLLTDIGHLFAQSALRPAFRPPPPGQVRGPVASATPGSTSSDAWVAFDGELVELGHAGDGFSFDNERPRHRAWLEPFELRTSLVTAGEHLAFVQDGGYRRPELWLSDGWAWVQAHEVEAPGYWERDGAGWAVFTLHGMRALEPAEPVCHVSYYEADAFARWAGARLPTEAEWERAAAAEPVAGGFGERGSLRPSAGPPAGSRLAGLHGEAWQWTASAYASYPGYRAPAGALGEYNGKFMSGQMVLRGSSCLTPRSHARTTYRNFFYPPARWQMTGIRLARDLEGAR